MTITGYWTKAILYFTTDKSTINRKPKPALLAYLTDIIFGRRISIPLTNEEEESLTNLSFIGSTSWEFEKQVSDSMKEKVVISQG